MANNYLILLVVMILLAVVFKDDFSFTLLYLFAGSFLLSNIWLRRSMAAVKFTREFNKKFFLGETIKVELVIWNAGFLPIPWLRIHEGLPVELSGPDSFQRVTSIGPKGKKVFSYSIDARRRGYYPLGPVYFSSASLLGISSDEVRREGQIDYVTVYPKIIPFTKIELPSRSPLGNLRHHQPIFEDPTRIMGKRDYVIGDSLRRIDWKSTATTRKLQVKVFEPSIALETVIFLNLCTTDFYFRRRIESSELAIIIAASLANWVVEKQGSVGLFVQGFDPLETGDGFPCIQANQGRGQLIRILDLLARVKVTEQGGFESSLRKQCASLPWGTTLTIITGSADDSVLEQSHRARQMGLDVILILAGMINNVSEIKAGAGVYGIPVLNFSKEEDLNIWRR